MEIYMPNERKQCELIWKPVYEEYRRLNYRLKKYEKVRLFQMANILNMSYDPRKHPCNGCTERNAFCHGVCERYKEFERTRPRKPQNIYAPSGKMRDPFHKKGRVIKNDK